jgi:predicted transport protein
VKAKPRESQPEPTGPTPSLENLIAAAKGYRPLYQMLEAMIRQVVPGVTLSPRPTHISFAAGEEFAIVQPLPQEIRLGLALPGRPHDANLGTVKIKGAGSGITHMITLKDARQINPELQTLIAAAAGT